MSNFSFKAIAITVLVGVTILVLAEVTTGWIAAARAKRANGSTSTATS